MSRAFCTITTASHLFKVYALHHSLRQQGSDTLHVLVVDPEKASYLSPHPGIIYHTFNELSHQSLVRQIRNKYSRQDHIRWCSKPVLLLHLLENTEQVIYVDNDLFFYHSYDFLFDYLKADAILLSPHWRIIDPKKEQSWLITNFREGIYNAGFLGVNQQAKKTLEWWALACIYRCERNFYYGLFDDQKYLDIVPALEPHTRVLHHKGCNVAGWNIDNCPRVKSGQEVLIENKFPVVFMHYANDTFYRLRIGQDPLLVPYLEKYLEALRLFKPDYDWLPEARPPSWLAWFRYFRWRFRELFNQK